MYNSKYTKRTSSESTAASDQHTSTHRLKSPPIPSDYEYLGRLVTRERPIVRRSKSIQQNLIFPQNTHKYHHSMRSHRRDIYKEIHNGSSDDDIDDPDGLNKPLGVIRISDRHYREIYRLPTPPPKVKRIFHRLKSPEPKVIERVFVRRPPPQIIENVIEVPPEKVRIIHREKYLENSAPVSRSKLVHLKSRHHHPEEEQEGQQYKQTYIPSEEHTQQQDTNAIEQPSGATTTLVYPPQPNMKTVGYIKSTVPPEVMFNSQQPIQLSPPQMSAQPMTQSTPYDQPPQQTTNYQMVTPTTYNYPSQQPVNYQMVQPTSNIYPPQQTFNQPMTYSYPPQQQMAYSYPPHQPMHNPPYGFTQYQ